VQLRAFALLIAHERPQKGEFLGFSWDKFSP